jgi:hypothetical protein
VITPIEEAAQLMLREQQSRDRGWWKRMDGCFAEDSMVDLSWFNGSGTEFAGQSQRMSEGAGAD